MSTLQSVSANVQVPAATGNVDFPDYVVQAAPTEGVFKIETFDSGSLNVGVPNENGFYWKTGVRTSVTTDNPKTGSHSLRLAYQAAPVGSDSRAEQGFVYGAKYPDLYVKYDFFVPANYIHRNDPGDNNKAFLMTWGGNYGAPGADGPKIGSQFYSKDNDSGESKIILFAKSYIDDVIILNKNWTCGTECADGESSRGIEANDKGHWMEIVVHTKYASEAQYLAQLAATGTYEFNEGDGVVEIWKKDWEGTIRKLVDVQNGGWYSTNGDGSVALGFTDGYLMGHANSGFLEETIFYIDNVIFSTQPFSGYT